MGTVAEKMIAIANAIREKTGVTDALTLDDMAAGVEAVYNQGMDDYYASLKKVPAHTYTPGKANHTISAGQYLEGALTIKGDTNLVPENIVSGVSIFGVEGTAETGGGTSFPTVTVTNNLTKAMVVGGLSIPSGSSAEVICPGSSDFSFVILNLTTITAIPASLNVVVGTTAMNKANIFRQLLTSAANQQGGVGILVKGTFKPGVPITVSGL